MTDLPEMEPEEETPPAKTGLSPTAYMSMLALLMSFSALMVALFEAVAVRAEQKADVWPYLEVSDGFSADGYSITVTNKGVGPARVRSLAMTLRGQSYRDLDSMILATLGPEQAFSYELYRTSNIAPGVLSADETTDLFQVPWEDRTRSLSQVWASELEIEVCYCSVYDDCWRATKQTREPVEANSCPISD